MTTTMIAHLSALLSLPNVNAFFTVLRRGESSLVDAIAFHMLVYGGSFPSLADHPRIHFDRRTRQRVADWRKAPPNSTTSAAGAFQETETIWNRFCAATGWTGQFDATGQSLCAAWLIEQANAMADVLAGRLGTAIGKCGPTWTSLPGAIENKASWTLQKAIDVYLAAGGRLNAASDAVPTAANVIAATPGSQETLTDVPDTDLYMVSAEFHAKGATVIQTQQPDGRWTVVATFPEH